MLSTASLRAKAGKAVNLHPMPLHRYFIRTPRLVQKLFPRYTWRMPSERREVYLTFDDGPHPVITPWVLGQLRAWNAKATFFCIGNNVQQYPQVYRQILDEGHAVGNHTHHHLKGWATDDQAYLDDVQKAADLIRSSLFRPPYGRIRASQAKKIPEVLKNPAAKIIMWDVLSADFDQAFSPGQCLAHVTRNVRAGSIVVFHDSEKAFKNLETALPGTLKFLSESGFELKSLLG